MLLKFLIFNSPITFFKTSPLPCPPKIAVCCLHMGMTRIELNNFWNQGGTFIIIITLLLYTIFEKTFHCKTRTVPSYYCKKNRKSYCKVITSVSIFFSNFNSPPLPLPSWLYVASLLVWEDKFFFGNIRLSNV